MSCKVPCILPCNLPLRVIMPHVMQIAMPCAMEQTFTNLFVSLCVNLFVTRDIEGIPRSFRFQLAASVITDACFKERWPTPVARICGHIKSFEAGRAICACRALIALAALHAIPLTGRAWPGLPYQLCLGSCLALYCGSCEDTSGLQRRQNIRELSCHISDWDDPCNGDATCKSSIFDPIGSRVDDAPISYLFTTSC